MGRKGREANEQRLSRRGELQQVATSCTKGSDRTSYLTRACLILFASPLLCSSPSCLAIHTHSLSFSFSFFSFSLFFLSTFFVCSACLRFIPSLSELVSSNLCLSLSLLVWFVGLRLGAVITEYPPLTSLVVLSPLFSYYHLPYRT